MHEQVVRDHLNGLPDRSPFFFVTMTRAGHVVVDGLSADKKANHAFYCAA
jgi:hypothetical protein